MNKQSKILATIFSFFIAFFLFLLMFSGFAKVTLMSQGYLLNSMNQSDYYGGIAKDINEELKKGAGAAGFEPSIYTDFVSKEEVQELSSTYIQDFFVNNDAKISTDAFRQRLHDYLIQTAANQGTTLSEADEQGLTTYIDSNVGRYEKYLSFPFLKYIVMGIDMLDTIMNFIIIACVAIVIVAFGFLHLLHLQKNDKAFYMSNTFFSASLLTGVIPIAILVSGLVRKINLQPESYYKFFVNYIQGYVWYLVLASVILFLLGGCILVWNKRSKSLQS